VGFNHVALTFLTTFSFARNLFLRGKRRLASLQSQPADDHAYVAVSRPWSRDRGIDQATEKQSPV
jgi:hypothetical protein